MSYINHDDHLVASRVARATYGIVCSVPVKEHDTEHTRRKDRWEIDPSGGRYVPGYFETKLRKVGFLR